MRSRSLRGMSLLEVIVGIALMLTIFLALFGVVRTSLELSLLAKAKAVAAELASSQMEYLRGLPYSALGTVGGTPSGSIASATTTTVGGTPYTLTTVITYYDDPADGTGGADENHVVQDYKKATVTVSYTVHAHAETLSVSSNFIPSGIETP